MAMIYAVPGFVLAVSVGIVMLAGAHTQKMYLKLMDDHVQIMFKSNREFVDKMGDLFNEHSDIMIRKCEAQQSAMDELQKKVAQLEARLKNTGN